MAKHPLSANTRRPGDDQSVLRQIDELHHMSVGQLRKRWARPFWDRSWPTGPQLLDSSPCISDPGIGVRWPFPLKREESCRHWPAMRPPTSGPSLGSGRRPICSRERDCCATGMARGMKSSSRMTGSSTKGRNTAASAPLPGRSRVPTGAEIASLGSLQLQGRNGSRHEDQPPTGSLRHLHPQEPRRGTRPGIQLARRPAPSERGLHRVSTTRGLAMPAQTIRRRRFLRRNDGSTGDGRVDQRHLRRAD